MTTRRTVLGLIAGCFLLFSAHLAPAQTSGATLVWVDPDSGVTFSVERGAILAGPFSNIGMVATKTTTVATCTLGTQPAPCWAYIDATVLDGADYCYRVQAISIANSTIKSGYSNTACISYVLLAPMNALAMIGVTGQTVTWTDLSSNETAYVLEKAPSAAGTYAVVNATIAANATSALDATVLAAGATACYRVKATNAGGASAYATAPCVTAPPTVPTQLKVVLGGSDPSHGLVTSSPPGISCGKACAATFPAGQPIAVLASTRSSRTKFAGWAGDCHGTATLCTPALKAQVNVWAIFNHRGGGGLRD